MSIAFARKPSSKDTLTRRYSGIKDAPTPRITTIPISPTGYTFLQPKLLCSCDGGCPRCAPLIQPKLTVGQPNDKYEQEADRVAEQVMRMPELQVQRQIEGEEEEELIQTKPPAEQITPLVQKQVEEEEEEEEEEEFLQTKRHTGQTPKVTPKLESRIQTLKHSGQPLSESERNFFEPRFGYDFSQVRVHNDAKSAESARALNARSFTVGRDVVFGAGQYAPETTLGKRLLAHELTHVVQQEKKNNCSAKKFRKGYNRSERAIIQFQRQNDLPVAPIGNPTIVTKAQNRSSGNIGTAYDWTPGWWYSPNSGLAGWRSRPLRWEEGQGAQNPPPSGEGIVNWGSGQPTCNLFVYDVLYATGFFPPLLSNNHYYDAQQTYNRTGALKSYFNLITDPTLVRSGDVMATGPHVEIVTSTIRNNSFEAIGAHSDGAYPTTKTYQSTMRFLRLVVLGDFPVPTSETRLV